MDSVEQPSQDNDAKNIVYIKLSAISLSFSGCNFFLLLQFHILGMP